MSPLVYITLFGKTDGVTLSRLDYILSIYNIHERRSLNFRILCYPKKIIINKVKNRILKSIHTL